MILWLADLAGFVLWAWLIVYSSTEEGQVMEWIKSEVPMLLGAIQAVLALVIAFGVTLSPGQVGAILAASAAVLAVVVRGQVSPKAG